VPHAPFIAVTDPAWFEYLASRSPDRRVDEVNFWSPSSDRPIKHFAPGEPVFFRLKAPANAIAGYGFFAHYSLLSLQVAWATFGDKNGDPDQLRFLERIAVFRKVSLAALRTDASPLGCTILREAVFWPRERWIGWGDEQGWSRNIVRGKTEDDEIRASRLLAEIQHDHLAEPEDLADRFELIDADERQVIAAQTKPRIGQGAFRTRLLDAYGRRCAITGEKTEPVLQAAHIQSYLGPRSNHVQNGILLSQEFHTLYDEGLLAITPELRVRVSPQIRERWSNGKRYYAHDGQPIRLPEVAALRPSTSALEWHLKRRFVA
jgi:putative restriction endonuclease